MHGCYRLNSIVGTAGESCNYKINEGMTTPYVLNICQLCEYVMT
jgi:hypothetical protein